MRTCIAVAAIVMTAAVAGAQPAPWQPERTSAGWTFTPGAVFGTAWDSNVTVQGEGEPLTREWVALISPRGELDYNGRQTRFNVGYAGSLEAYRRFSELNRYEQRGKLELRHQASARVGVFARGGMTISPTTDRLETGNGTIPFVDVGSQLLSASTGVRLDAGPRTHLELAYRFQDVRFDERDAEQFALLRGGYAHAPGATLMYDATRRFSLGASWQYQHARLEEGQTFDLQSASAEVAYRLAETTTVSAGGGVSYLQATNGNVSTTGPAIHGSLQHSRGPATFSVSFARAFTPTYTFGGITTSQTVSGGARLAFAGSRGYVSGSVSHGRTDPVEQIGLGFRTDSLWFDGAVGYSLARWLRAEAFYTGTHQTSTARGNIDRARIGIQFVTFKPVRIE